MASSEIVSSQEQVSLRRCDLEIEQEQEPGQARAMHGQNDSRQLESKRIRACVLIGASILQLPMWGFATSYGVFQNYYQENLPVKGSHSATGVIGTTSNGVIYLSMPIMMALFTKRWAHRRREAALCGATLTALSFVLSSFSTQVWHLIATQGVMAALGCALLYSPTTLSLGEWFKSGNRAVAYGVTLSCKNIVGSACPLLFRGLLDHYDFRVALRIWTGIVAAASIIPIFLILPHPSSLTDREPHRLPKIPWSFLRHQTFYIYSVAIILQSAGYGLPQTYVSTYARDVTKLSETWSTLLVTLFNIPGVASSLFFGYLSDNKRFALSASVVTAIPAIGSALSAILLWGLTSKDSLALLLLFSITFGCFSGGYSATWGGVMNELEREAAQSNEAIDSGMVYGLLNGARGIGFVSGGLVAVPLLNVGSAVGTGSHFAYGTRYGALILFTGISSMFGGWSLLWKWKKYLLPLLHLR